MLTIGKFIMKHIGCTLQEKPNHVLRVRLNVNDLHDLPVYVAVKTILLNEKVQSLLRGQAYFVERPQEVQAFLDQQLATMEQVSRGLNEHGKALEEMVESYVEKHIHLTNASKIAHMLNLVLDGNERLSGMVLNEPALVSFRFVASDGDDGEPYGFKLLEIQHLPGLIERYGRDVVLDAAALFVTQLNLSYAKENNRPGAKNYGFSRALKKGLWDKKTETHASGYKLPGERYGWNAVFEEACVGKKVSLERIFYITQLRAALCQSLDLESSPEVSKESVAAEAKAPSTVSKPKRSV